MIFCFDQKPSTFCSSSRVAQRKTVVVNADGRLYVMKSERKGQKTGIKGKSVLAANSLGARAIGPQQRVGDHSGHNHQL